MVIYDLRIHDTIYSLSWIVAVKISLSYIVGVANILFIYIFFQSPSIMLF